MMDPCQLRSVSVSGIPCSEAKFFTDNAGQLRATFEAFVFYVSVDGTKEQTPAIGPRVQVTVYGEEAEKVRALNKLDFLYMKGFEKLPIGPSAYAQISGGGPDDAMAENTSEAETKLQINQIDRQASNGSPSDGGEKNSGPMIDPPEF